MEKFIEIPEGYEARIEGNKVILEPKPSEDERMRKLLIKWCQEHEKEEWFEYEVATYGDVLAWLEKQKIPEGSPTPDLTTMLVPNRYNEQKPLEWSEEDVEELAKNRASKSGTLKSEMSFYRQGVRDAFNYKGMRSRWKPSEQEKGAIRTAIHVLTEERNFPKTAVQLQNILNAFEGKESRKDWKPSEEQMEALSFVKEYFKDVPSAFNVTLSLIQLYDDLKELM